mmetsp:Transcript_31521/g.27909  ORF Transcript_31521/g.27909 Transcript_31521/m.27909 type:complete len:194 (+) Transcript_31521:386-967(+)
MNKISIISKRTKHRGRHNQTTVEKVIKLKKIFHNKLLIQEKFKKIVKNNTKPPVEEEIKKTESVKPQRKKSQKLFKKKFIRMKRRRHKFKIPRKSSIQSLFMNKNSSESYINLVNYKFETNKLENNTLKSVKYPGLNSLASAHSAGGSPFRHISPLKILKSFNISESESTSNIEIKPENPIRMIRIRKKKRIE